MLVALTLSMLTAGCSRGPSRARPPKIDPATAGALAIKLYDTSGDGELDASELAAAPGVLKALKSFDADSSGKISATEIAARITDWQKDSTGLLVLSAIVQLDGRPLEGATVRLVPEPFLGDDIHPAEATTSDNGQGVLRISAADLPSHLQGVPGVAVGVYRIEVTHPSQTIPTRYNAKTELGLELSPGSPEFNAGRFTLKLKSGA
jgi:hypothetical protein